MFLLGQELMIDPFAREYEAVLPSSFIPLNEQLAELYLNMALRCKRGY